MMPTVESQPLANTATPTEVDNAGSSKLICLPQTSDGLGHPRCQWLGVVEQLGRVVDWFAVSELKLGNPNRTPRMDHKPFGSVVLELCFPEISRE
jgi:hypothetical protein